MDYFTWADRQGMEHPLVTTSSTCNSKSPTWMTNKGEVTDISQLPITNIKYGPLKFQEEKINITLGPIVCHPSENTLSIREQMVIAATLPMGTILPWVNRPHLTSSKRKSEIPDGWQR